MARTFIRQDVQIRNSNVYDDTITPSLANFETSSTNIESDLNAIRSQLHNLLKNQTGNWYDDLNVPSSLETGVQRSVNEINSALHLIEKKRVLRDVHRLVDITVSAGNNFVILGTGQLPSQTTAAVGTVTTLGTVVAAHGGTFGTHVLSEVSGANALSPQNLMIIVDGSTRDPILSGGRQVYGLLQGESGLSDGGTITDTTTTRVQISFVRQNASGDDLEACPVADIENAVINYSTRERVRLEDLNEADFLRGAIIDVLPTGGTVDLQTAITNQGATPVDVLTNIDIDLEAPGLAWCWRDDTQADLLCIIEGSAGGTSEIHVAPAVDVFNVDAVVNDFLNGASFDTGAAGTTINVGVTANQIDSGGALQVQSGGAGNLDLQAANELNLTDGYRASSTWSLADGIPLANSASEWSAFEAAFGETSLLDALVQASNTTGITKTYANVTANVNEDINVSLSDTNLDAALGDLSGGSFVDDYDIFVNGQLLRNGANAAANHDVYPGTDLNNGGDGQLKFEFKLKIGDVVCVIGRA